MNIIKHKEINFLKKFAHDLLDCNIDISISNKDNFIPWVVSNFVNILHDNKIFISSVDMNPEINSEFNKSHFSFSVLAKSKNESYFLDLILLQELDSDEFEKFYNSEKVCIVRLDSSMILEKLLIMPYLNKFNFFNISKDNKKCLLIFSNNK